MFCPKCSQQQASGEARFCSRCGFQLDVVKVLLSAEDARAAGGGETRRDRAGRSRDRTIGAAFMFACAFLVSAVTIELPPSDGAPVVLLVIMWLLLTVLINIRPLFRYFVGERRAKARDDAAAQRASELVTRVGPAAPALPRTRGVPAQVFAVQGPNTAEVSQPPSVVEHTTNLLDRK